MWTIAAQLGCVNWRRAFEFSTFCAAALFLLWKHPLRVEKCKTARVVSVVSQSPLTAGSRGNVHFWNCEGETSGSGRRPRGLGARGKPLPGEKQRLKRAKIDAKRAVRAAAKGFDPAAIVAQLEQFVLTEGDMKVRADVRFDTRSQHVARTLCGRMIWAALAQ